MPLALVGIGNPCLLDGLAVPSTLKPVHPSGHLVAFRLSQKQLGLNPVKLTLEMLRLEKPFEADVDADGNVIKANNSKKTAKKILNHAKTGTLNSKVLFA